MKTNVNFMKIVRSSVKLEIVVQNSSDRDSKENCWVFLISVYFAGQYNVFEQK